MTAQPNPQRGLPFLAKTLLDRIAAAVGLLLLSPILLVVAVLVRLRMGSPVLFQQPRPGYRGRIIHVFKFRTMTDERDARGNLLPDGDRLTAFGRFMRRSSLDELPQLWNVVRGDVSLVGPRPLRVEYLDRYTPEQMRRHDVMPGITGWAQVNGRNATTWDERFRLDLWYVDHWSFWLDLRILWMTIWRVLRKHGIESQGHATMPEFTGSAPREHGAGK